MADRRNPAPAPSTPIGPRSILVGWQRPVVKTLVVGGAFVAATGLFLVGTPGGSPSSSFAFLAHVVVGALLLPPLFAFVVPHAIAQTRRRPWIAMSGAVVLGAALALAVSGTSLVLQPTRTGHGTAWWTHLAAGLALPLLYVVHRAFGQNPARPAVLAAGVAMVVAIGGGFALWERAHPGAPSFFDSGTAEAAEAARVHFFPSSATTGAGRLALTAQDIKDVSSCGTCHRVIAEDWKRSAHRHASMTNPFYRASIEDLRARFPASDARWCASCHDPALLFTADPKTGEPKMISKDLDFDSEDARVGLTCISCHAVDPQSTNGNADYVMRGRKVYFGERDGNPAIAKAHDVLLRLKPEAHAASLTPKNIRESGFCSLCHKAEPPPELNRWKWVRAQDEHDAHDDSGVSMGNARSFYHPPAAKRCQDCHMPLVADPADPAADGEGMVRSHLFAAANTALPHMRGDTDMIRKTSEFLKTACRVDVTAIELSGRRTFLPAAKAKPAVKPGEIVQADVVVRNVGVGHRFPGGTVDSNEVWIDFEARVGDDAAFYASGKIDPKTNEVDPSAEYYRSFWLRRDGTRFVSRVANDLYTFVYVNRIGPGSADVVRYRFKVPEGATGELRLTATLRYRKFMLPFAKSVAKTRGAKKGLEVEHQLETDYLVLGEKRIADLGALPIVDMAKGELSLPITAEGTPGPAPAPESLGLKIPEDRERVNDLAIAMLVQRDPESSRRVFESVTRIDPKYADGWVNVARAAIELQDLDGADAALDKALALKPGLPKARFFRGQVLALRNEWAKAEVEYEAVLKAFPRDRESWRQLANVRWQQDKMQESLAASKAMLEIDPEDWKAWFWAMKAYDSLGDEPHRAAAQAAHDRFRNDDDALARAAPKTLSDPNLHNLAQPIHVHEQAGLSAFDR
jgi:tetratricopeptide (TPR) repeat protein